MKRNIEYVLGRRETRERLKKEGVAVVEVRDLTFVGNGSRVWYVEDSNRPTNPSYPILYKIRVRLKNKELAKWL